MARAEARIAGVASATGAIMVATAKVPPYLKGTAWLASPRKLVTNRHVLLPSNGSTPLVEGDAAGGFQTRPGFTLSVDFSFDNRIRRLPAPSG